ncbi:MAG TPA: DUF3332 family protein [Pseudomonadales bacterium]|nr:DUF3332 family protein [Pseudomonadales bacterium]
MYKKIISCALVLMLSGCFGSFEATRGVYRWNKSFSHNKVAQEALFLGLVIIPVYAVATLLDAIIINSVEFWTGDNPMAKAGDQKRVDGKDGSYAISTLKEDGSVDIQVVEANGNVHFMNLQMQGDKMVGRDMVGDVVATSNLETGAHQVAALGASIQ